jgi:hypothetical protein
MPSSPSFRSDAASIHNILSQLFGLGDFDVCDSATSSMAPKYRSTVHILLQSQAHTIALTIQTITFLPIAKELRIFVIFISRICQRLTPAANHPRHLITILILIIKQFFVIVIAFFFENDLPHDLFIE